MRTRKSMWINSCTSWEPVTKNCRKCGCDVACFGKGLQGKTSRSKEDAFGRSACCSSDLLWKSAKLRRSTKSLLEGGGSHVGASSSYSADR
eukprot:6257155-Amphidinium_carterae.1